MMKKISIVSNLIIIVMFISLIFIANPIKASLVASSNPHVYYNGNKTQNNVCYMINVYWGTEYLKDMLDVFDAHNVKTTFFVGGSWAAKNIDMLKEIYSRGHEIGNHGYNHKDQNKLTDAQNYDEINMTHKLVRANLGIDMTLFAPPSGAFDSEVVNIATSLDYKTIMWSKDTIDWRDKNTELIINRATKNLSNGDLVLMHPTKCTLDALNSILTYTKNNGYNATTVSKTLGI